MRKDQGFIASGINILLEIWCQTLMASISMISPQNSFLQGFSQKWHIQMAYTLLFIVGKRWAENSECIIIVKQLQKLFGMSLLSTVVYWSQDMETDHNNQDSWESTMWTYSFLYEHIKSITQVYPSCSESYISIKYEVL